MLSLLVFALVNCVSCAVLVVGVDGVMCMHRAAMCRGFGGLRLCLLLCRSCVSGGGERGALSCLYSVNTTFVELSSS